MQNNEKPLVSVVIPCYNHEKFVQDCIQSVIDQTYENIELIIIDDGSKDNSVHKIQEMIPLCEERFVRFEFRFRPNKGLSATLNEALEWCNGKYFSAIASDDQMLRDKTLIQVKYLEEHNQVCAVMGAVNWIDSNSIIVSRRPLLNKKYSFEEIFLLKQNLNVCTQMAHLDIIKSVGGYKDGFIIEDWYMWLKLAKLGGIVNIPYYFVNYRTHDNNTINNGEVIYKGLIQIANEYSEHYLYFKVIRKIVWHYVASVILLDKRKGWKYFINIFFIDILSVFSKDFYRCVRNFLIK